MARVGRRTKVQIDTKDAWSAVQAFEHMIPQLRSYARAMTGNGRLEVRVTAGPTRTDGNTIYITPPLALANKEIHSKRSECGKRSADGKLTCKACNIREVVNFYLYHEVSHILWGTLAKHNEYSLAIWHKVFNTWHHEDCEHYAPLLDQVDRAGGTMGLANLLSPFTEMMQNALEDARVNERTFEQRPGLREIFRINMDRMLIEGSEQLLTGDFMHWRDQPLDAQFMVGLYFQASGYEYSGFLHEDAVAMLRHPGIVERTEAARNAEDADAVFAIVCEIWMIAQQNGFCLLERCVKPEPEPESLKDRDDDGTERETPEPGDGSSPGSPGAPGGAPGIGGTKDSTSEEAKTDPIPDEANEGEGGDLDGLAGTGGSGPGGGSDAGDSETSDDPGADAPDAGRDSGWPDEGGLEAEGDTGYTAGPDEGGGLDLEADAGVPPGSGTPEAESDPAADGTAGLDDSDREGSSDGDGESGRPEDESGDPAEPVPSPAGGPAESDGGLRSDELVEDASDDADRVRGGWIDAGASWEEEPAASDNPDADGDTATPGPGDDDRRLDKADAASEGGDRAADGDSGEAATEDEVGGPAGDSSESDEEAAAGGGMPGERVAGDRRDGPEMAPTDAVGTSDGPTLGHGTPDDAATALRRVIIHALIEDMAGGDVFGVMGGGEDIGCDCGGEEHEAIEMDGATMDALKTAIAQRKYFDEAAFGVAGLNKLTYPNRDVEWDLSGGTVIADYMPSAALLSRPTLLARRVFEANAKTKIDSNRKSGRVNTRVLGRRAPSGDPRLFGKKTLPKKKSHAVTIVVDCSGSMDTYNMERIKRFAMAMAEILHRLGIPFSMFGHSASEKDLDNDGSRRSFSDYGGYWVYIMPVKEMHEPWNDKGREKLVALSSVSANLDGHALEYARKEVMKADATDRIIFYFSDGGMPAENREEEKEILQREIPWCRKHGITLLGGGIDSDATARVGMDTVMLRQEEDITKLIEFLQKNLTRSE